MWWVSGDVGGCGHSEGRPFKKKIQIRFEGFQKFLFAFCFYCKFIQILLILCTIVSKLLLVIKSVGLHSCRVFATPPTISSDLSTHSFYTR